MIYDENGSPSWSIDIANHFTLNYLHVYDVIIYHIRYSLMEDCLDGVHNIQFFSSSS